MRRRQVLSALAGAGVAVAVPGAAFADDDGRFPDLITLPVGFRPEGIAIRGLSLYNTSLANGAVFRSSLRTGRGAVVVPGTTGGVSVGIHTDDRNRLWVARGPLGDVDVYDAGTGALLARYDFTNEPASFVNDCAVTPRAVYFTDSGRPFLYVVPLGPGGRLPAPAGTRALPLQGDVADPSGFNNGIVATPDGRLIVVRGRTGTLYSVDPATGASTKIDLGGASVLNGDGLVRHGRTLYVCQNRSNQISVFDFDRTFLSARLRKVITDPRFDVPSTIARFGPFLYAVNARFGVANPETQHFEVVRVRAEAGDDD